MNGDYTGVVPPVPIPNTEVKCAEADDTPMGESRKSPFTALDFFCLRNCMFYDIVNVYER